MIKKESCLPFTPQEIIPSRNRRDGEVVFEVVQVQSVEVSLKTQNAKFLLGNSNLAR